MKKVLLSVAVLMLGFTVNGQKTWNFSDEIWASAAVAAGTTVDGLTNYSTASKPSVGGSNKTYTLDDVNYSFTSTFKFGETGSFNEDATPKSGVLAFDVTGNVKVSAIGTHASSSGDGRELVFAAKDGDSLKELGSFFVYQKNDTSAPEGLAGALVGGAFEYKGNATTIYIYSRIGGVNLYLVKYAPIAASGLTFSSMDKDIQFVQYFDLLGKEITAGTKGIVITKTTYQDGSVITKKALN